MLNFDDKRTWSPSLSGAIGHLLPDSLSDDLVADSPEFVEDACALYFSRVDRQSMIGSVVDWIESTTVAGYHGSRLTDAEVDSIRGHGLLPLDPRRRRTRLERALAPHPRWPEVAHLLDETLRAFGSGGKAGDRAGQVHLTLSRQSLTTDFSQYLTYGADFDRHVAHHLLGDKGVQLLRMDGQARIIKCEVPGRAALAAAHPHFSMRDMLDSGQVPNLVNDCLQAWSYGLAHPDFECSSLLIDCGMVFRSTVPASWIVDVEH